MRVLRAPYGGRRGLRRRGRLPITGGRCSAAGAGRWLVHVRLVDTEEDPGYRLAQPIVDGVGLNLLTDRRDAHDRPMRGAGPPRLHAPVRRGRRLGRCRSQGRPGPVDACPGDADPARLRHLSVGDAPPLHLVRRPWTPSWLIWRPRGTGYWRLQAALRTTTGTGDQPAPPPACAPGERQAATAMETPPM